MSYRSVSTDSANLHRFFVEGENRHFYTANNREKDLIMKSPNMQHYNYEGIAFKVYGQSDATEGSLAVVRYLNKETGSHLYSTSPYEQSILDASSEWVNEGIAWYGEAT